MKHFFRVSPGLPPKQKIAGQLILLGHYVLENFLRGLRIYQRGYHNALQLGVRELEITFPDLPESFNGLRVLFLSDFHIGGMEELPPLLVKSLAGVEADLCLMGGDYRFSFIHPEWPYREELEKIVGAIHAPLGIYGVLGNHDDVSMIPELEAMGIRMLHNDSVALQREGQVLYLCGADEPIHRRLFDLEAAFKSVPENAFKIFLVHSPCLYKEAQGYGAQLYVCGHTHQGQIRFPHLGALITLTAAPRAFAQGIWCYEGMVGYTGPGVGSAGPTVRFRCPPEVVVLTLKTGSTDQTPENDD